MSVSVEFVGHACFRIWIDGRPSIVTDPYPPGRLGLPPLEPLAADTVIVSSLTDEAHSHVELVAGSPRVINALDVARGQEASLGGGAGGPPAGARARDPPPG
ncbi:MAG: MBL fold metallo-hydrolase, partial [Spirochaetaceae bacterium]|nr:MBL fold metallo-hydrolase [Spirochaetaceae bacterium]